MAETVAEAVQAHAEKHAEKLDRLGPVAYDVLDLWTRMEPGSRRPRFTREEIAGAAVHVADTEGIDALSMRRLATELGAGTMTLYHYVRTKEELLALVTDTVMAEILLPPDQLPTDWRAGITAIVAELPRRTDQAPVDVRHRRQSSSRAEWRSAFRSVAPSGRLAAWLLDRQARRHLCGGRVRVRSLPQRCATISRRTTQKAGTAMMNYVARLSSTGDYPQLAALIDEYGIESLWSEVANCHERDHTRFDRNLERLLDGIALSHK